MAGFPGNQYIDIGGHTNTFITGQDEMRYGPVDQNQPGYIVLYDQTRAVGQHIETRPIQEGAHVMYGQAHFVPDPTDQDGMASIALNNDLQEGNGAQSASPQPAVIECPSCSPHSEGDTFVRGQAPFLTTSATPAHDCGPNMQSVSGFSDYRMNIPSGGHLRELPLDHGDIFPPYLQNGTLEMSGSSQPRPEVSDRDDEYGRTTTTLGPISSEETRVYAAQNYITAQQPATRQINQLPVQLTGPSEFEENGSHGASNFVTAEQPTTRQTPHIPSQQRGAEQVQFPQYSQQHVRVQSFRGWPQWSLQQPVKLAEAGFFYTGESDICCCFHCGGVLRKWDPDDDPVHEHEHWYQNCPFIRKLERKRCETAVKTPDRALEQRIQDLCIGGQVISEELTILVGMGFKREDIKQAMKKFKRKADIEEIVEVLLDQSSGSDCSKKRTEIPAEMNPLVCLVCRGNQISVTLLPCSHIVCFGCATRRGADGSFVCGVCGRKVKKSSAVDRNTLFG